MFLISLILACFVISRQFQVCQALASEHAIYDTIFNGYNKYIRPVRDANTQTFVKISPQWLVVYDLDAANEAISFNIDYTQTWNDEYLQWNTSDFGGIETISVPERLIWLPDICMVYSYNSIPLIPKEKRKARITYDGNVTIWNPQVATYYCGMMIDNFPFDSQTCTVTLSPWTLTTNTTIVTILPTIPNQLSTDFKGNQEWNMLSFVTSNKNLTISTGVYSDARMTFTLKRNYVYYICVLLIPTFIMTTLCLLGIFAPFSSTGDREEKVTLGLTTLLTIAVILNSVADDMPKSSKLPVLGWFVIAELAMCTIATLFSVLIMFLHQRAFLRHYSPPRWFLRLVQWKKASNMNGKGTSSFILQDQMGNAKELQHNLGNAFDEVRHAMVKVRHRIEKHENDEVLQSQWSMIMDFIDFVLLITFQAANILLSCLILFL